MPRFPGVSATIGGNRHEHQAVKHPVPLDSTLTALLNLHAATRRLLLKMERRQRLGRPLEDFKMELAFNRLAAKGMLAEFGWVPIAWRSSYTGFLQRPTGRHAQEAHPVLPQPPSDDAA